MVVGDITTGTEVLVVGGGPAGYTAAIRAAQHDLDVTLVERADYGGTCLNHGCIPSKALVSATDLAHRAGSADELGIEADPSVDLERMVAWKDGVVDQLTGGVEKLCKGNGVTLLEGTATFAEPGVVRVAGDGDGEGAETHAYDHAVIATGSRPVELDGFSFADDPVLDSRAALSLTEIPDRLAIVGAGYIGMELAGVFAKLGSEVTVLEALGQVLPGYEQDLARPVRKRATSLGVTIELETAASGWEETDDGIRVTHDGEAVAADAVLVAVGREPVTDELGLEAIDLGTDESGAIPTDEVGRTDRESVFAVGDVAGEPMLAHAGMAEGELASATIAGETPAVPQVVPAVVFTDPEVATAGFTASEAEDAGYDPVVGEFPFRASGRALTADETDGFVRVVADESGYLLGAEVVGPEASELVAELTLALELGATLEDVATTVHAHPTLAEATMEAAENALGQAIHTLNR